MLEPTAPTPSPQDEQTRFVEQAIGSKEVTWQLLLELGRHRFASDPELEALGDRYFLPALGAFEEQHPDYEVSTFSPVGGVYLTGDGELLCTFSGDRIRFEWADAWPLVNKIEMLAEEAREWWRPKEETSPDPTAAERRPHSIRAYGLATWVIGAISEENERHRPGRADDSRAPSEIFKSALQKHRVELKEAEERFRKAAQRTAQSRYWQGALLGAAGLVALCAVVGALFWWRGVEAAYGVALLTGGVGAMVSLLQRMSSGKLEVDIDAGRDLLEVFGAVRPFIGAIFGLAVMALLLGGLIPAVEVPPDQELAFFAGIGFLAGFNERWAQDMLTTSTGTLQSSPGGTGKIADAVADDR